MKITRISNKPWYRIKMQNDGGKDSADIYIYDVIGQSFWDPEAVSAKQLVNEVNALPDSVKTLNVHINSPGGNVFDGVAIANFLKQHKATVNVIIEALAASAASIVAMAGDKIIMADNALMMIHHASALVIGNATDMLEMAALLEKISDSIVTTYQWHSNLSAKEIRALMDKTTWMNAEEAVKNGFATDILDGSAEATNSAWNEESLTLLGAIPERFRAAVFALAKPSEKELENSKVADDKNKKETQMDLEKIKADAQAAATARAKEIIEICGKVGMPECAAEYVGGELTTEQVKVKFAGAQDIRDACTAAKFPDRATGYIKGGLSIDEVRKDLLKAKTATDAGAINSKLGPEDRRDEGDARALINPQEIYARRRKLSGDRRATAAR
jgi:ATP-dependent protease ClpP protease subunit